MDSVPSFDSNTISSYFLMPFCLVLFDYFENFAKCSAVHRFISAQQSNKKVYLFTKRLKNDRVLNCWLVGAAAAKSFHRHNISTHALYLILLFFSLFWHPKEFFSGVVFTREDIYRLSEYKGNFSWTQSTESSLYYTHRTSFQIPSCHSYGSSFFAQQRNPIKAFTI